MSRHVLAICFDFGDTLVDEASEVKDETFTTLRAELIPGAGRNGRSTSESPTPSISHSLSLGKKHYDQRP